MDFKSLLNKLDSMEAPVATPAAPKLEQAVQLNEDAQLRVLSGRTTYVAEAKKKKDEEMAEEMKVGDSKKTAKGGTVTKTATGIKHEKGDYSDDDYVAPKASKAAKSSSEKKGDREADAKQDKETKDYEKKNPGSVTRVKDGKKVESIDESSAAQKAAREKFMSMVKGKKKSVEESAKTDDDAEAKKKKEEKKKKIAKIMDEGSKPDFLDMDKDGDKKEPMKKAVADKKGNGPKKGVNPFAKKTVKESVEPKLTFKEMIKLVQESGGQQSIDPIDAKLFAWAQRVASAKFNESAKQEVYAGLVYERNGGRFEMYDVLSEDQK
jgi:hypothetical protein